MNPWLQRRHFACTHCGALVLHDRMYHHVSFLCPLRPRPKARPSRAVVVEGRTYRPAIKGTYRFTHRRKERCQCNTEPTIDDLPQLFHFAQDYSAAHEHTVVSPEKSLSPGLVLTTIENEFVVWGCARKLPSTNTRHDEKD